MGYKVKWVEENLGVSRKALRGFEAKGLMPKNMSGQYRDYSDEDINRIWMIRILQGMGYSLEEIVNMKNKDFNNFDDSIAQKVEQLEREVAEKDMYLGYAKTIKLTGRFPSRPKEMGSVKFEDFHKISLTKWNVNSEPNSKKYQEIVEMILNKPEEEWNDSDLGKMLVFLGDLSLDKDKWEQSLAEQIILKAIVSRIELGSSHPEVQLLVKMMYESRDTELNDMTIQQFVRFNSTYYMAGDVARMQERIYGKEGCKFIANALAVFGGYKNYETLED